MDFKKRIITKSTELRERGNGFRFSVKTPDGTPQEAFVVRFNTKAYGYLNSCAHLPVELDWNPGHFFDESKDYLICATHGATYQPDTGRCISGPCVGAKLQPVAIFEDKGDIYHLE